MFFFSYLILSFLPDCLFAFQIAVGGKLINPVAYRKNIAYVMQDDSLMATATPREALKFSATMRLPSSVTPEEITARVEGLLGKLGLMVCADVLVGGPLIKGISGGQRKRTSVGVELITDPQVCVSLLSLRCLV
jgi:ABC-type multidrug transport system ATPase subunit